jgi:hypothetical protein
MMEENVRFDDRAAQEWEGDKAFLDEHGSPSHRAGPDLTRAEPIETMLARLAYRKTVRGGTYAVAFCNAARESGIDLSVTVSREGEERLSVGMPCDSQEMLRRPRYDALVAHIRERPQRRQCVIDHLNRLGRFVDNRRYASVREATDHFIAAGGRIFVLPDGRCEEALPMNEGAALRDDWDGHPLRRMSQRYLATMFATGAREKLAELVRAHGATQPGSGMIVWRAAQAGALAK